MAERCPPQMSLSLASSSYPFALDTFTSRIPNKILVTVKEQLDFALTSTQENELRELTEEFQNGAKTQSPLPLLRSDVRTQQQKTTTKDNNKPKITSKTPHEPQNNELGAPKRAVEPAPFQLV